MSALIPSPWVYLDVIWQLSLVATGRKVHRWVNTNAHTWANACMLTSLSACMLAERTTHKQLSQWIINGCNVMTDDSEQPVPPHPWPSGVILVSTVRKRQRPTQFDWLILSSTLLPSLHSVQSELSLNLSQSLSAWMQSHRTSHRHYWKRICPPSTIFFNSLYVPLQSSRPTYHVLFVVLKNSLTTKWQVN